MTFIGKSVIIERSLIFFMDKAPENLEKFEALAEKVLGTIESIGEILTPGEPFALHPDNFEVAEEYTESPEKLKAFIVSCAQKELGVHADMIPEHDGNGDVYYKTNQPNTFLGTDGTDWWIEIIPAEEIEKIIVHIKSIAIGDSVNVADKGLSQTERLAKLREAKEVVEDDSDLNDIFMYVRSDMSLTQTEFLKSFPKAKALVITPEQLGQIEAVADGNYFSYVTSSGKKKYVNSEEMEEPLVLFLEDLGG